MILDFHSHGTASTPQSPIDNKEKELPPPYSSNQRAQARVPEASGSTTKPLPVPSAPAPTVNQLHLHTGSNPISGTFYVDPKVPNLGFNPKGSKSYKKNPPHASFRTRQGAISLELAPTGEASEAIPKANVLVASRSGDIHITLLPTTSNRPRIGLDVVSRKGNIILFLPQTFVGALQIHTRKGKIEFLPALSRAMKVLKQSEDEAFVMVGEKSLSREVDFCQLNSREGRLIVGFAELDKHEAKAGFWKKLGQMFGGD